MKAASGKSQQQTPIARLPVQKSAPVNLCTEVPLRATVWGLCNLREPSGATVALGPHKKPRNYKGITLSGCQPYGLRFATTPLILMPA